MALARRFCAEGHPKYSHFKLPDEVVGTHLACQ
jgi:hypothetical protein